MPGMTMYSTTEFAVVGFTQQLRWVLAPAKYGVDAFLMRIVCALPAWFLEPLGQRSRAES
jgi:NAD(P)-dependent dehydrogenase (short-subunit alcohol dehydrogenase family)